MALDFLKLLPKQHMFTHRAPALANASRASLLASEYSNAYPAYRRDIDGLRGLAVLAVAAFHASPSRVRGGFVGVDVFFVISGFLISSIIFRSLERGGFNLRDFYLRRIKRIFPALVLVLAACLLFGRFALLNSEYDEALRYHIPASAASVMNILLWDESGYFDAAARSKPLLHLWSLGVEEQFYLVWPLLVALAWKSRKSMLATIGILACASYSLSIWAVNNAPIAAFYLPVPRFWELLTGAALAYISTLRETRLSTLPVWIRVFSSTAPRAAFINLTSATGLLLILSCVVLLNSSQRFPGWYALLPTLGAALVICAGPRAWLNSKLLGHRCLVFVGLISYPLYLWHWPLLSFCDILGLGLPSPGVRLAALAVAFLLAWLTYRFVETPVRRTNRSGEASIALVVLLAIVATAAYGAPSSSSTRSAYAEFFNNKHARFVVAHNLAQFYRFECDFYDLETKRLKSTIASDCYTPKTAKAILIWGDSHAQQFNYGLKEALPPDISLLQVATSGCAPSLHETESDHFGWCNKSNRFAMKVISAVKPQVVILAQRDHHEMTDWTQLAEKIKGMGVSRILLVGPVPQWTTDLYKIIARRYWSTIPRKLSAHLDANILNTDESLKRAYRSAPDISYLSVMDKLCDTQGCIAYLGEDPRNDIVTFDYGHLTPAASAYVGGKILAPAVLDLLTRSGVN